MRNRLPDTRSSVLYLHLPDRMARLRFAPQLRESPHQAKLSYPTFTNNHQPERLATPWRARPSLAAAIISRAEPGMQGYKAQAGRHTHDALPPYRHVLANPCFVLRRGKSTAPPFSKQGSCFCVHADRCWPAFHRYLGQKPQWRDFGGSLRGIE